MNGSKLFLVEAAYRFSIHIGDCQFKKYFELAIEQSSFLFREENKVSSHMIKEVPVIEFAVTY